MKFSESICNLKGRNAIAHELGLRVQKLVVGVGQAVGVSDGSAPHGALDLLDEGLIVLFQDLHYLEEAVRDQLAFFAEGFDPVGDLVGDFVVVKLAETV